MSRRLIDISGQRFGKLIVLKLAGKDLSGKITWDCICDCGNVKTVRGYHLKRQQVTSCGCSSNALPHGMAALNIKIRQYKSNAKNNQRIYTLTRDEAHRLFTQQCHYCGSIPRKAQKPKNSKRGFYEYNGIDRIDNDKGYTSDNVITCCYICNRAKRELTYKEFVLYLQDIYEHLGSGVL